MNGFYIEAASANTNAIRLAQNEVAFLIGANRPLAPAISQIFYSGNGQFEFSASGSVGLVVIIEASPDLRTWTPLQTNTLSSGSLPFTDNQPPFLPSRFYRLRSGP